MNAHGPPLGQLESVLGATLTSSNLVCSASPGPDHIKRSGHLAIGHLGAGRYVCRQGYLRRWPSHVAGRTARSASCQSGNTGSDYPDALPGSQAGPDRFGGVQARTDAVITEAQ